MTAPLEWLVIGGGVQGTLVSHFLVAVRGVPPHRIRVIDPHERPLARWFRRAAATGMDVLRSPGAHHLDIRPDGLVAFAAADRRWAGALRGRYERPTLALFRAHTQHVVASAGLGRLRLHGTVQGLELAEDGVVVDSDRGCLRARRVVVAVGGPQHPRWPAWANHLRQHAAPIDHVFDDSPHAPPAAAVQHQVIVGGGISGLQLATRRDAAPRVTVVARSAIRVRDFDADARWLSSSLPDAWSRAGVAERRRLLESARCRGSVPADVADDLRQAQAAGRVRMRTGEVIAAGLDAAGRIHLDIGDDCGELVADRVRLATGFETTRPRPTWLDHAAKRHGLPVDSAGAPIVDAHLRWRGGLHVAGPLAEQQIGPFAGSILGGRRCAQRLVAIA